MYGLQGRKRRYSLSRNWGSQKRRFSKRRRLSLWHGSAYYASRAGTPKTVAQKSHPSIARIGTADSFAPDSVYTILKWSGTFQLAAAPGNRTVFRGNSPFDPGFTAGSTQPVGWGSWITMYTYFRAL